jgi:hypothetical protein
MAFRSEGLFIAKDLAGVEAGGAADGGGAGGFLGVAAVCFDLTGSGHKGFLALRIEEGFRGFGGGCL